MILGLEFKVHIYGCTLHVRCKTQLGLVVLIGKLGVSLSNSSPISSIQNFHSAILIAVMSTVVTVFPDNLHTFFSTAVRIRNLQWPRYRQ